MNFKTYFPCLVALSLLSTGVHAEEATLAYVGTYNPNGEGVYLVEMNPETGALTNKGVVSQLPNAAQLVLDSKNTILYVASEVSNYNSGKNGSIGTFSVDKKTGALKLISEADSQGAGPVYLSLTKEDKHLLVANYQSGSIAVFPTSVKQGLDKPAFVFQSEGVPGAPQPEAAVEGSFAISDHNGPHAHMIGTDPSGKFVFSTDLGLDRIYQWKLDHATGKLTVNNPAYIMASSKGAGPRHFVFHPNGQYVYLINEESSTITFYHMDDAGALTEKQTLSSLPNGYKGTSFASGLILSPDAKFAYVANRLHNSISVFAITDNGQLRLVDNTWTQGDYTRTITFDPKGKFLYAMNQRSDNISTFSVDSETGKLTFTGAFMAIGSPSQMVFVK